MPSTPFPTSPQAGQLFSLGGLCWVRNETLGTWDAISPLDTQPLSGPTPPVDGHTYAAYLGQLYVVPGLPDRAYACTRMNPPKWRPILH